jgi:hypothetical protein
MATRIGINGFGRMLIPIGLRLGLDPALTMLGGLILFGVVFALNSSVHSYLVLAYSEADRVSLSVGFYYMANACGRLLGTLLSGLLYQRGGVAASLWERSCSRPWPELPHCSCPRSAHRRSRGRAAQETTKGATHDDAERHRDHCDDCDRHRALADQAAAAGSANLVTGRESDTRSTRRYPVALLRYARGLARSPLEWQ